MQEYIDIIREYSKNNYKKTTRQPMGQLKFPFIVPGSNSYLTSLWDWDSWLTDVAIRQIMSYNSDDGTDVFEYEKGCIYNFVDHMKANGRTPISIYADRPISIFRQEETNIHKPCFAQHIAFIIRENGNSDWLVPIWDKIELYIGYYLKSCKHTETGLFFWINDWAIGVDNDPCTYYRPYKSSASIYLNCMMYKELLAMEYIGGLVGKKAYDYKSEAQKLKESINEHLWDEKCGFYFSADLNLLPLEREFDVHSGMPRSWHSLIQRIDVWSGFMALWAGIADKSKAERVVGENLKNERTFCAKYGVRTLSKLEKMYTIEKSGNPSCWLGPIWGISNYMCFRGLLNYGFYDDAKELVEKTVNLFGRDLLENGSFHEYYHPDTGEGVNNPGFQSWNLLVNNMLAWYENKPVIWEF
ncbi:MAG: glycoside hydrolase family 37 [Firmicutes bacterium]|nr:glycoside hydrolase family 37 [Bacillota bacterium]